MAFAALTSIALLAAAEPALQPQTAILPFATRTLSLSTLQQLEDELLDTAKSNVDSPVLGGGTLFTILGASGIQDLLGCGSSRCIADIVGVFGVTTVVDCTVDSVRGDMQITFRLLDVRSAKRISTIPISSSANSMRRSTGNKIASSTISIPAVRFRIFMGHLPGKSLGQLEKCHAESDTHCEREAGAGNGARGRGHPHPPARGETELQDGSPSCPEITELSRAKNQRETVHAPRKDHPDQRLSHQSWAPQRA